MLGARLASTSLGHTGPSDPLLDFCDVKCFADPRSLEYVRIVCIKERSGGARVTYSTRGWSNARVTVLEFDPQSFAAAFRPFFAAPTLARVAVHSAVGFPPRPSLSSALMYTLSPSSRSTQASARKTPGIGAVGRRSRTVISAVGQGRWTCSAASWAVRRSKMAEIAPPCPTPILVVPFDVWGPKYTALPITKTTIG